MWISPDRIVSDVQNFEWGNSLHRIWYARDSETGLWHPGAGHRSGGHRVLVGDAFAHPQAYVGDRKKQKTKLYTLEPGTQYGPWTVVGGSQVVMTLVETRQAVDLKRQMADAYDKKGGMLFDVGDEAGADNCWDSAITLRTQANELEDKGRK